MLKRLAVVVVAIALASCDSTPAAGGASAASPSPHIFGTATLSATACDLVTPDHMPLELLTFRLVNNTLKTPGRFFLARIAPDHSFQDVVDWWNGPMGQVKAPSFLSEIALVDVAAGKTDEMVADISTVATYAFHCGYVNDAGTVTGFWHQLVARS